MRYPVRFSPQAISDLDEIHSYISSALNNPEAADRTINKILDKADLLAESPEIGAKLFLDDDLFSGYRYLVSDNYLAFYRVADDAVYVDRVLYGRRDHMKLLF